MSKSLQEHFDYVVSNLLKQNAKSTRENGGLCAYRGEHGRKCAAGWLIPDDKYDRAMDDGGTIGGSFKRIVANFPDAIPEELRTGDGFGMVVRMQEIHDRGGGPSHWRERFSSLAADWGLSDAVCKEPSLARNP